MKGPEITDLFKKFGPVWKVYDLREIGQYPMDLTDSFQEDGTVVRIYEGWSTSSEGSDTTLEWIGRYWIDGDLLCVDFQQAVVGGMGCRPVFRNPDATPGGNNEYVIVGALGFYEISRAD